MGKPSDPKKENIEYKKVLNQFWYCPKDGNILQIHHSRRVQSPYFDIYRKHVDVGINNALASKRIPPEATTQTKDLVELMFMQNPTNECVELISVCCSKCGEGYAAPKIEHVEDLAETQARALFETHQALQTKSFGPFRFYDRFGVGQYLQRQRESGAGSQRWLFYIFFLGIRTIAMVLILYYIMGLEIKLGKKWYPLGIILLILSVIGFALLLVNSPVGNILKDAVGGFYFKISE